jgi:hypothetical protein
VLGAANTPPVGGATYVNYDALAFISDLDTKGTHYENLIGMEPLPFPNRIWTPLLLPVGSKIVQIRASYQQQPIVEISRRPLFTSGQGTAPAQVYQKSFLASPGGAFADTENLDGAPGTNGGPVTIEKEFTYTLSVFCTSGTSIYGVSVGYFPPVSGWVPWETFKPTTPPRVLDTRITGGKIAADSDRVIDIGVAGPRSAVFNLTAVDTDGPGFLAAFAGDIPWPGNSSVNFTGANQVVANLVVCALDSTGKLKLRAGARASNAIIDMVGFLF